MPGRVFLTKTRIAALGFESPELVPRRNIAPGQEVCALTEQGFRMMRWGLIPVGRKNARGRPVMETIVNARSETVFDKSAFEGVRRAVLPVEGWYEWIGAARRKTAWEITPVSGGLLWFAAIWDVWHAPGGAELAQLATVTCAPNGDVRDIHDRMGVLLGEGQLEAWLTAPEGDARALLNPAPDGSLQLRRDPEVDWSGA